MQSDNEVRLKGLVLLINQSEPPVLEAWDPFKETIKNVFGTVQIVSPNDLKQLVEHPYIRLSEVPTTLQSRHHPMRQALRENMKVELGMSLFYLFDDGLCLEFDEVLFHPYNVKVNPDVLPLVRGLYGTPLDLNNYKWVPAYKNIKLTYGDMEYVLLRIIKNAQKMIANRRISFNICWGPVNQGISLEFPVRKVNFVEFFDPTSSGKEFRFHFDWQTNVQNHEKGAGNLVLKTEHEGQLVYKNMLFDTNSHRLRIHHLGPVFNDYEELIYELRGDKEFQKRSFLQIAPEARCLELESHETIQHVMDFLRSKETQEPNLELHMNHTQKRLTKNDYSPCLYISSKNEIKISLRGKLQEKSIEAFNMGHVIYGICNGLQEGFRFLFEDEKQVVERRGLRRSRDLKLLKHIGIFNYFIYEVSHYFLHDTSVSGKVFEDDKEYISYLFKKMGEVLSSGDNEGIKESLEDICSKSLTSAVEAYFLLLKNEFLNKDLSVYCGDIEYRFERGKLYWLQLVFQILKDLATQSQSESFFRSRTQFFPWLLSNKDNDHANWEIVSSTDEDILQSLSKLTSYSLQSQGLKKNIQLSALYELVDSGWNLYLDGKPLEAVDEEDFKWRFELEEKSEVQKGLEANKKIDWFALNPRFFLRGSEVDFESALGLTQGGWLEFDGKIFVLKPKSMPSIDALEKFWKKISAYKQQTNANGEKASPYFKLQTSQSLEMLALRALGIEIEGGETWQKVCQFYDSLGDKNRVAALAQSTQGELKPYQKNGLRWLQDIYNLRLGGILADDMGLGKTVQTLSFLDYLREAGELGKVLILVPTSLVYNWMSEADKFTPSLNIQSFNSREKEKSDEFLEKNESVLVVTYGLFTEHAEYFESFHWNIHIYDEAQNLKNIVTKRTTTARKVKSNFKLCLTGTPLENHLGEFYSLIDIVVPGALGPLEDYKKTYVNPYTIKSSDMKVLKAKVKPLVLRRTKSEILTELPKKTVTKIRIPFGDEQRKIYRDVALSWNQKVKDSIQEMGEARSQMIMLTALLRLRQVCSDPNAIPGVSYTDDPPKVNLLSDSLKNITESGESAIIFTQFIPTLERMVTRLEKEGVKVFSMDGRLSKGKREKLLREFNEYEGGAALCMTLKTGGVGLNLTKASYVFHLEPWWNPAVESQATDRVHRIGQERPVQVYRYIMEESVEEKIEILKQRKSSHFEALFKKVESEKDLEKVHSQLTQEDFEYLLS